MEFDPFEQLINKVIENHFFNKKEKVIAFEIRPGRDKIVLVEVDKNFLVNLKDWQEFKGLCIPVPTCIICQMWHTCGGRC